MTSALVFHGASGHDVHLKRWIMLFAFSGLLIGGTVAGYRLLPHATVTAGPVQALSMLHQSFGWTGTVQDVELRVKQSKGHSVRLYLDGQFLQTYAVEQTVPMAKTVISDATGGQMLTFDAPADADLGVKLSVRPLSWGQHDVPVRADVPGVLSAESTLSQFVVP